MLRAGADATGAALGLKMEDPHYYALWRTIVHGRGDISTEVIFPNNDNSTWIWQLAVARPTSVTRTFETSFDLTGCDNTSAKMWP